MRRCVLTIATLLAGFVAAPRGQVPDSGTIAGHVTLTARIKGRALPSTAYPTRAVGAHDPTALPEIRNVVVYIKDAAPRGVLPVTRGDLRREHETFLPHVLAITRGSTVDFPNDDPIFHNVFSLSSAATFDLRRYPLGQRRSPTPDEITVPVPEGRAMTMAGGEGEWALGGTKVSDEVLRTAFERIAGTAAAYEWFVQGQHTLSPRWFVAARREGTSAPPLVNGTVTGSRTDLEVFEATTGFRATRSVTLRSSYYTRRSYGAARWTNQVGFSAVWSQRWW